MDSIAYWLNSCSFEEPTYEEADHLCKKNIAPYFQHENAYSLESFITATIQLYKEVQFIRDNILGDRYNINIISRKEFAINVMHAWMNKHQNYQSIVKAICYDLPL